MRLTTENTALVLDSTSDYPEAPARFPNMRFVPLYVRFGEETYRDYVELGPAEFFAKLRSASALPQTSQPTPEDFLAAYRELDRYERIYSVHVSSKVSGTLQSAELAAQELGGDRVRVVDSLSASLAIAMLAHAIQRRLARGTSDEEIAELVERFHRDCGVVFTVETLEYLQRGGRIGRAAALAGSLLNLRPVLSIADGEVIAVARVRGRQKALAEFEQRFVEATEDRPGLRVAIAHADAPEWVGTLSELVWRTRPQAEIEFTGSLGAVVSTHAGPGAVGFFWFQD
ncbi:MAG TPA: DegV family protein [Gaiellaceae bacterium]|jgi:DegV family protein with EDD domain|nr:DegV family protein [Gaiellaceae bacterium]